MSEVVNVGSRDQPRLVALLKNRELGTHPIFEAHYHKDVVKYVPERRVDAQACHAHFFAWKEPRVGSVRVFDTARHWALPAARSDSSYTPPRFLKSYWSKGRREHAAVASSETEKRLLAFLGDEKQEYVKKGLVCAVETCPSKQQSDPQQRTQEVWLLDHVGRQDSRLAAEGLLEQSIKEGYTKVGVEFHSFVTPGAGRGQLNALYSESREDSAVAMKGSEEEAALLQEGYIQLGPLGYVHYTTLAEREAAREEAEAEAAAEVERKASSPNIVSV